ncbi:MAG TPA: GNAT family N-acetyltransferase [Micromonosporaceae bacterium]|jgi:ribosomal protein S18 acetylase RimI-like enzyme
MTEISLRRVVPADAAAIGAVFDAAVRVGWTYMGDMVAEPMFPPEEWDHDVAEFAPPNLMLAAVDETDRIVGFTAVKIAEGELYLLFVDPAFGGRGIGHLLLDAAHDAMRAAGRTESFLYTHESNERALAVYGAAGYRRDGAVRESDFRGLHLREPRLVKPL